MLRAPAPVVVVMVCQYTLILTVARAAIPEGWGIEDSLASTSIIFSGDRSGVAQRLPESMNSALIDSLLMNTNKTTINYFLEEGDMQLLR